MALPFILANLSSGNNPVSDIDTNLNAVAAMGALQCAASGTNTIALTQNANQPQISSYVNYGLFSFVAAATSTSGVQVNVNGIGALNLYRTDGVQATTGDVTSGTLYIIAYNSALNTGAGGFQIIGQGSSTKYKTGTFSRDISLASGTQAITGVGFTPKAIIIFGAINTSVNSSFGFSDGTNHYSITQATSTNWFQQATVVAFIQVGNTYTGVINSFDADGFTIGWTKTSAPAGTANLNYLAFR